MKRMYLSIYHLSYCLASGVWSEGSNRVKGVGGVTLLDVLILMSVDTACRSATNSRTHLPNWVIAGCTFVAFAANYRYLLVRGHGPRFSQELTAMSPSEKRGWIIAAIATYCVV